MKYSQFNSVIPFNGKYALYNSLTQKVIFLVPELNDLLKAALNEGIENIKDYHPYFYNYLIANEFIIDSSINEIEKIKIVNDRISDNENEYLLTINPTMNCNFKCWYCYETHIKDSKLSNSGIIRIKKFIKKTAVNPKIKKMPISFFGGEPLLYFEKNIIPIIDFYLDECKKNNIQTSIGFTSNGYLVDKGLIDYFLEREIKCSFQITLDGYKEDHDMVRYLNTNKGSYDKIVENIHLLIESNFPVSIRVNYTDNNIQNAEKIINDFINVRKEIKEKYLVIDFHRVWQNGNGLNVDVPLQKIMDKLRNNGFYVDGKDSRMNNLKNPCYADKKNSVVINYNGDIYKCTARDFTMENREGVLDEEGNLIWENDSLNKRMNSKFKNKSCLSCKILPICNGGCSQVAIENAETDYCIFGGEEQEKDKIISQKIAESQYRNKEYFVEQEAFPA